MRFEDGNEALILQWIEDAADAISDAEPAVKLAV
jgi:hypothetical protein